MLGPNHIYPWTNSSRHVALKKRNLEAAAFGFLFYKSFKFDDKTIAIGRQIYWEQVNHVIVVLRHRLVLILERGTTAFSI